MKRRILFVDDEDSVLDALEALLRKERDRWEMIFVMDGAQALRELRKAPFDLVISDMRMPGMDGAELLAHVKEENPSAARMILSGHSSREAVIRSIPVAQQFLAKPCNAAVLRKVIDRTLGLRSLLESDAMRAIAGKLGALPTPPHTYTQLTQAAARQETTMADLAAVVERDPAMSAKALQLVNSAYFGIPQPVTSVHKAVTLLGVEVLKGLALVSGLFATADAHAVEGFSFEDLAKNSFRTAQLAKEFLRGSNLCDEAFTAALLRDVGKLVFALGIPDQLARALRESQKSGRSLHAVETELLGVSHAEAGAYLLGLWGLPFSIVEAVAFHHTPGAAGPGPRETLAAVHAADALAENGTNLDLEFLAASGFSEKLVQWRKIATEALAN
jgi:HD-like signal output (HDOD) protein/ActR/RegA family two-component response regulator